MAQVELKEEIQELIQEFTKRWTEVIPINNLPPYIMQTLISTKIVNVHAAMAKPKRIIYFSHTTTFKSYLVIERISRTGNYVLTLIDVDGNSFLLYKTRSTLKSYLIPYPAPSLSLRELQSVQVEEIQADPINYISKYFFGIPEPESSFMQGNLTIVKLKPNRFTEFVFKYSKPEPYDEQQAYYNFYNHFIPTNSAWLSKIYFGNYRFLKVYENCEIEHPEHPPVSLTPGYYLLYHPPPRQEEPD